MNGIRFWFMVKVWWVMIGWLLKKHENNKINESNSHEAFGGIEHPLDNATRPLIIFHFSPFKWNCTNSVIRLTIPFILTVFI